MFGQKIVNAANTDVNKNWKLIVVDSMVEHLDLLIKRYHSEHTNTETAIELKNKIETIASNLVANTLSEDSSIDKDSETKQIVNFNEFTENVFKSIYLANQKLPEEHKLRPTLSNATLQLENKSDSLHIAFDYWIIKNCTFTYDLSFSSWDKAELEDVTFSDDSIYELTELAKANLKDIEFSANGYCELDGGESKLSDECQNGLIELYREIEQKDNEIALLKAELKASRGISDTKRKLEEIENNEFDDASLIKMKRT